MLWPKDRPIKAAVMSPITKNKMDVIAILGLSGSLTLGLCFPWRNMAKAKLSARRRWKDLDRQGTTQGEVTLLRVQKGSMVTVVTPETYIFLIEYNAVKKSQVASSAKLICFSFPEDWLQRPVFSDLELAKCIDREKMHPFSWKNINIS